MSEKVIVNKELLVEIADTIREKNNITDKLSFPNDFKLKDKFAEFCSRSFTTYSSNKITKINNCAFYTNTTLKSVSFPNVTTIGERAFYGCNSLKSVSFPNVTNIGSEAFFECISLTSVSFPKVTNIETAAFVACINLETIILGTDKICNIESEAFVGSSFYFYVRQSLIDAYKTEYQSYADKFRAIEDYPDICGTDIINESEV